MLACLLYVGLIALSHLQELAKKDPTLVVPYCYHMYMAMLAGGQMIEKMVKTSFSPPEGEGLNAFAFNVKSRMDKINAIPHDEATKALMLQESVNCFKMNNQVVRSLDGAGNQFARFLLKWVVVLGLILAVSAAAAASIAALSLEEAPLLGQCQRLCPPQEETERRRCQELSRFERATAASPTLVAVKKYRRAAAGRAALDARDLRPAPVLLAALRHLFTTVLVWPDSGEFLGVYHFLNDRIRSVRQDFTIQRIEDASLATALQQTARFYLLAGLRAAQLLGPQELQQDWSARLNDEQLVSALAQLQALACAPQQQDGPAAAEFVAYDLLLHADDARAVAWTLRKLPPSLRNLPAVGRALRTFVALQTDAFHAFFGEFRAMTLLEQAAVLRHVPTVWTRSLHMLNKACGKQDRFPLEELARWLQLTDSESEGGGRAERLCNALNLQTQRLPPPPSPPKTSSQVADSWEADDALDGCVATSSSASETSSSAVGFVQFKLAPLKEELDPEATRLLLHDLALQIERSASGEEGEAATRTATELVMGRRSQ
ncbi:hypothetical protein BBJ28_00015803 [Nothophytophthora sp. Chile5]|nr:hypothetical protein BBJ28_00015803 [Nothophytophthora sp. Chile5]